MSIFQPDPKISKGDRERLLPELANEHRVRVFLREEQSMSDLQKCVILELERRTILRRSVLNRLLLRIRDIRHAELERRVISALHKA